MVQYTNEELQLTLMVVLMLISLLLNRLYCQRIILPKYPKISAGIRTQIKTVSDFLELLIFSTVFS